MERVLYIRFGALGDLCLLGTVLSRWKHSQESAPPSVTLLTKPAFAPLMAEFPGVDQVITLPAHGQGNLLTLARDLRRMNFDRVIDAHGVLRSHWLLLLMGRRPDARLQKDTAARLALLGFGKNSAPLTRTMIDRFGDLCPDWDSLDSSADFTPLGHWRPHDLEEKSGWGLAPGAQWDSKRWPEDYFARLAEHQLSLGHQPLHIFLGPREETWFGGSTLEALSRKRTEVLVHRNLSLVEVGRQLARCRVVVTNDSGLLHLAEAVGTPVLAFFGPTVRQFGYFPHLARSRVLEESLECRPCSRNGKKACHREDLACLRAITPEKVAPVLSEMLIPGESSS